MSQRVVSLFQPTGMLHVGNYLGALRTQKAWTQNPNAACFYGVASLHALTTWTNTHSAESLYAARVAAAKWLVTIFGPDATLFDQALLSPSPVELGWLFQCMCSVAQLQRLPQYATSEHGGAGFLTYPALMAADIVYCSAGAKRLVVPVGEDQRQHIELAQVLVQRLNYTYRADVAVPQASYATVPRIPALDGKGKMSKSRPDGCVFLTDTDAAIVAKVRRAKTSTDGKDDTLHLLLQAVDAERATAAAATCKTDDGTWQYGKLKAELTDALIAMVRPLRERYLGISDAHAVAVITAGSRVASASGAAVLTDVKRAMGLS